MKKALSIVLCALLILSMATTTYATGTNSSTTISLTVPEESYTLTIPPSAKIDPTQKVGEFTVSVTDVNLVWSDEINVCFDAANAVEGEFGSYLKNTENNTTIPYLIFDNCGSQYKKGSNTNHAVESTGGSVDGNVRFEIDGTLRYPGKGTYTDTLTFYVSFANRNNG